MNGESYDLSLIIAEPTLRRGTAESSVDYWHTAFGQDIGFAFLDGHDERILYEVNMDDYSVKQPDDYEYFKNKRCDRTYVTRAFRSNTIFEPEDQRELRIVSKILDIEERPQFAKLRGELVLRLTPSGRQEVKVVFYQDNRDVKSITIQRFEVKSGTPHRVAFTMYGDEIEKFYNMLRLVRYLDLEGSEKVRLDDSVINDWLLSEQEKRRYLVEDVDPGLLEEVIRTRVTKTDVVALAYRRHQLALFERLLSDEGYLKGKISEWKARGIEDVWQKFFEQNPWIFGYGLRYIFTSPLDNRKLEQVTTGYSFLEAGKRTDALMKTRGLISSLCFVEIKTHRTQLLNSEPYRSESWRISNELAGAIAQVQKTVQKTLKTLRVESVGGDGSPTGEVIFNYQPKAIVVIGCLDEFRTDWGVNEQKYSSFELFRRNTTNPEIITFDELYDRAKFIVELAETDSQVDRPPELTALDDEDIPF